MNDAVGNTVGDAVGGSAVVVATVEPGLGEVGVEVKWKKMERLEVWN